MTIGTQNQKTILMTGSTGSFGRYLALELANRPDVHLILLVRGDSEETASNRVSDIKEIGKDRVEVYKADILVEHFGLNKETYEDLSQRVNYLLHSAASTRFNLPLEEARLHNVTSTIRIIEFANLCTNLIRFGYLSTAFVSGKRMGLIKEDEFEHDTGFSNSYQESKYESEKLIRDNMNLLPTVIFRPPLIISSEPPESYGKKHFNFFPILIGLISNDQLPYVPGTEKSVIDLVESKSAAKVIVDLFLKPFLSHNTYHITNGDKAFDIKTFHRIIEEKVNKKIPIEYWGDIDTFSKKLEQLSKTNPNIAEVYKKGESFLLEPAYSKIFDNKNTLTELGISNIGIDPLELLEIMINNTSWNLSE